MYRHLRPLAAASSIGSVCLSLLPAATSNLRLHELPFEMRDGECPRARRYRCRVAVKITSVLGIRVHQTAVHTIQLRSYLRNFKAGTAWSILERVSHRNASIFAIRQFTVLFSDILVCSPFDRTGSNAALLVILVDA